MSSFKKAEREKIYALEESVLNDPPSEVARVYKELGEVAFTARALGLACRFRDVETVRALVDGGASFDYDKEALRESWRYFREASYVYAERPDYNYAAFVFDKIGISYLRSCYLKIYKNVPLLSLDERLEILRYLCENSEKVGLDKDELYFFSFFTEETEMREFLKNSGAAVPETWRDIALTGSHEGWERDRWFDYCLLAEDLNDTLFITNMTELSEELGGGKFHFTEWLWDISLKKRASISGFYGFLADKFDLSKAKKSDMMKFFIDGESVEGLAFAAENGWLKQPKKRDEMIAYANAKGKTEATAWLLDFKNRTADLAAEQAHAEKRQQRELNAAPDSAAAMKKLWKWENRDDGTVIITGYRGDRTEIVVPEKICGGTVTAIGEYAFSPDAKRILAAQRNIRKNITKITLPDTITEIGKFAFFLCKRLYEINIPPLLSEIPQGMLDITDLRSIVINGNIKKIGGVAFYGCRQLKTAVICEGVEEIEDSAFYNCGALESVELPRSIKRLGISEFFTPFTNCYSLTVTLYKGSYAEQFCKENKINYIYKGE